MSRETGRAVPRPGARGSGALMCGLAGFLEGRRRRRDRDAMQRLARCMSGALVHRGPDAAGEWVDGDAGLALGHRRLAILDLTPSGAQPMVSADGRHVLAFNGEVYNHGELRERLAREGVAFRGRSDTEALLEACARWGVDAALRVARGMLALALWDRAEGVLHLAVDRMGKKPLYHGYRGDAYVFGSELKALHRFPGPPFAIDRDAAARFAQIGYVPAPLSIFQGIAKLEPGTRVEVRRSGDGTFAVGAPTPWFSLDTLVREAAAHPAAGDEEGLVDRAEAVLGDAVAERLVADVPVGALLSGGIDSSTVVALARTRASAPVRTFSIGFGERGYDESTHAERIAAHLGTEHRTLRATAQACLGVVEALPDLYDEPFADSSQIPSLVVSRLAREAVTVALTGDGGDEVFGGYNRHRIAARLLAVLRSLPRGARTAAAAMLRALSPAALDRAALPLLSLLPDAMHEARVGEKVHKLAALLGATDEADLYRRLISQWPGDEAAPIRAPGAAAPLALPQPPPGLDAAARFMFRDTMSYLPGDVLAKVDRASMSASLEVRCPLLDVRVLDLAWSMPARMRVRGTTGKWLLREVLARHLPRELFTRPKAGFAVPIGHWLRGPLRPWAERLLAPERLEAGGLFSPAPVRERWLAHLAGRRDEQHALWNVLVFEQWRERWMA